MDMIPQDDTPQKRCTKCNKLFPATPEFFSRQRQSKDGLRPGCKSCMKAQSKVYNDAHSEQHRQYNQEHSEEKSRYNKQYREAHRDEINEQKRRYYRLHKEEVTERGKQYRATHKEQISERGKRYHAQHREELRQKYKQWHDAHREERREKDRRYKEAHKEQRRAYREAHKEEIRMRTQLNYRKNREKRIAYGRKHREEHHERYLELYRTYDAKRVESRREYRRHYWQTEHAKEVYQKWAKKNHDTLLENGRRYSHTERGRIKGRAKHQRRRALKIGAGGVYTATDVRKQFERQRGHCYYCGTKLSDAPRSITVDHIIPLTRGGTNDPGNIVIACQPCNSSKHNKLPHEWHRGGRLL